MSRSHSLLHNEYGLSSDEDVIFEEEEEESVEVTPSRTRGTRSTKLTSPMDYSRASNSLNADGKEFMSVRRRFSGSERKEKRRSGASNKTVSFLEYEEHSKVMEGDQGQSAEVEVLSRAGEPWWFSVGKLEMWQLIVLGCLMGLLVGIVYRGGIGGFYLELFPTDNLLKCPSEELGEPCLNPAQIRLAQLHLIPLRTQLHIKAGQFECGMHGVHTRGITIEELRKALPQSSGEIGGDVIRSMLLLILHNPHWNIIWLEQGGRQVKNWPRSPDPKDQLQSTSPSLSMHCRVSIFLLQMWSKLKLFLLVVVTIAVVVGVVRWQLHKRRMFERSKFMMVDKILGVLRRHHETMKRKKDLIPYLAIIHVRDMLIAPSERDRKQRIWDEACAWIAKFESRVRVERQRIAGEDFDVWKWIQEDPPPTEDTVFLNEGAAASSVVASVRKKNWYNGTTFEDHTGKNSNRMNSPYGSPSQCIRLKNMFEAVKHMKDDQSKEIEDSVLDRCIPHGGVVHIYVDRRSPFGCVYLKMSTVQAAVKAYKAMHGGWYKGKLITAKYIPLEKYHKWFAAAINAEDHIFPSS